MGVHAWGACTVLVRACVRGGNDDSATKVCELTTQEPGQPRAAAVTPFPQASSGAETWGEGATVSLPAVSPAHSGGQDLFWIFGEELAFPVEMAEGGCLALTNPRRGAHGGCRRPGLERSLPRWCYQPRGFAVHS